MSRRYRFVSAHSSRDLPRNQRHAIARLCRAVNVKRSGYCARHAAEPARAAGTAEEAQLAWRIRRIHTASRCTYGAKRVALDLAVEQAERGGPVNHRRVARVMREHWIEGRHQSRRRNLTKQDPAAPPAPDLLGRDFAADALNAKRCGDIT